MTSAGAGSLADRATPARTRPGPEWIDRGLSSTEVRSRREAGHATTGPGSSQSLRAILGRNALTRLNFLLVALGAATLATGSAPDSTFLAIALINTVVGTVQEVRAKRTLDALAVINAPHSRVVRDGVAAELAPEEIVVDDLLLLGPGDQVTADAVVADGTAEVDESLATGEADPVPKRSGDRLLSGSWVVAGSLRSQVTSVGADSYANRLAAEARRFSLATSELMTAINWVLRTLSWIMLLLGPVLILRQLQVQPWRMAIRGAVAGLVGMIPEGLVLLTTLAFLAAAVRLSRRRVLVQELPAVETLARVDALCVDKTGTLTEGRVTFTGLVADDTWREDAHAALAALARLGDANATMRAIGAGLGAGTEWHATNHVPFSSARKWSGATFGRHGTWVLGAPEMVHASDPDSYLTRAVTEAARGARVLVVARGARRLAGDVLPPDLEVVGLAELEERTRPGVSATLGYFADQGVTVRVISGDSTATVKAIAERVGLPGASAAVDARELPTDPDRLAEAADGARVFGRVTPEDKRKLVRALQKRGHTVAMTGDGVNDVLALKEADLGIAMGSGSAITRGVAQIVNLEDDFDVLPSVVAEGRRVLANIETVASLFLVKNVYSFFISVTTSAIGWPYPFLPRHLTLISAVGIGIPGFFLALAPNSRRFVPGFLRRVLVFSVVAGSMAAAAILGTYGLAREEGLSGDASRTAAIVTTVVVTLWVLQMAARPLTRLRLLLVAAMGALFMGAYFLPVVDSFFSLQHRPGGQVLLQSLVFGAAAAAVTEFVVHLPVIRRLTRRP